jgi:BirA family biotin operon repressor/biotin-[acetyl-CoA-carboxylase] ligase
MISANQVLPECGSTNDELRALAEAGHPDGTWISARLQTAGRGRQGRVWFSEPGNLYLSYLSRLEDKSRWSWIPIATAVSVVRSLTKRFPALDLRLKWPNDLWIVREGQPRKLGGILCEAVGGRAQSYVIVGIGINCVSSPDVDQPTDSLSEALSPRHIDADEIREAIVRGLHETFAELESRGAYSIKQDFLERSAYQPGAPLEWHESGSKIGNGKFQDLGPSGELIVINENGERHSLFAEEIRVKWN